MNDDDPLRSRQRSSVGIRALLIQRKISNSLDQSQSTNHWCKGKSRDLGVQNHSFLNHS